MYFGDAQGVGLADSSSPVMAPSLEHLPKPLVAGVARYVPMTFRGGEWAEIWQRSGRHSR